MKNPYQRLIEECGVTLNGFRKRFDFSAMTMRYIVDGRYVSLSDRMITSLGELCHDKGVNASQILRNEYHESTLQKAYISWQIIERMQVSEKYLIRPPRRWTKDVSPFDSYVLDTAKTKWALCKDLKLDAAAVGRYASGKSLGMPKAMESAFRQIGYPYLSEMLGLQFNWRMEYR